MSLPNPSHLQFAVLSCLGAAELSGRDLRAALKAIGVKKTGAAFYQLMARLEEANWVKGQYHESELHGENVRERRYKITGTGAKARAAAIDFYHKLGDSSFDGLTQPGGSHA